MTAIAEDMSTNIRLMLIATNPHFHAAGIANSPLVDGFAVPVGHVNFIDASGATTVYQSLRISPANSSWHTDLMVLMLRNPRTAECF